MNSLMRCLIGASLIGSCLTGFADDRCIQLEGQSNFRDVGGYQTSDGKSLKRGVAFRSGRMPRLTDDDVAKLQQLGIKTVVNSLTPDEIEDSGKNRLPRGAKEILHPIDSDGGLAAKNQGIAPEKVDMTNINAFYILKGSYIDATRAAILKMYGGIEKYLTDGLGLTTDEIQQLRDKLLE